jgi:PAS domain S-box-containing protein
MRQVATTQRAGAITAMNSREFQLQGVSDSRLANHATSALPAWLWSVDGTRLLWANPVGAALFGAANATAVVRKTFGPAEPHRRQIALLANRLSADGAVRLERLRGFGAPPGMLMTCTCARLIFADGSHGILIAAVQAAPRAMPLVERLQRLVEGMETPAAAFTSGGLLAGTSDTARALLEFSDLAQAGLDHARSDALTKGRVELPFGSGHMVLQRVGSNHDVGLVALITLPVVETVEPEPVMTDATPHAEFVLVDEFAEPLDAAQPATDAAAPALAATAKPGRRAPLCFTWQMDATGRFSLGSDQFSRLIGVRTATGLGRPWSEIAENFGLDPEGRVLEAIATQESWSGITLYWPVDGGGRLPVELSGLPMVDAERNFAGYRGFGVCRDLDSLDHLAELRRLEPFADLVAERAASGADTVLTESQHAAADKPAEADVMTGSGEPYQTISHETSQPTDLDEPVDTRKNVVPFRPLAEPKSPVLTPVENHAFDELARQLNERLDPENGNGKMAHAAVASETATDAVDAETAPAAAEPRTDQSVVETPEWLVRPEPPARGVSARDRALLDLLPNGVLIYRLDRLLYANPAFLSRVGYDSLHALEHDGGLDALYVEPGSRSSSSTSEAGMSVTIMASPDPSTPASATEGRLFTISWDGESALALIFSPPGTPAAAPVVAPAPAVAEPAPLASPPPLPVPGTGRADAEDFGAILDTTTEGIVIFDAAGNIHVCNRSAETLFGYDGAALVQKSLAELFAPESRSAVLDELERIKSAGAVLLSDQGREVIGRVNEGGMVALSMIMGRTRPEAPNFFAVFRETLQPEKGDDELQSARRLADGAANAKADMLARISHEVRSPLSAIIGFAEVMIAERFGTLGNERYVEYMKDIRASGERVVSIIDDLTALSKIETGKLDLAFANQNLNEMVESCVSVMQPHANRERIVIRTSLANALPPVVADGRALRQITLNLIGTSIHLANPAGQVIVSTALSDFGEVVLRVRDTGHGLNDNEVAAALEPFRTPPPPDQTSDNSGVSLSLTKALVEANRAQFHIKTGGRTGTLIEVVFPHAMARS